MISKQTVKAMTVKNIFACTTLAIGLMIIGGCASAQRAQLIQPTTIWPDDRGRHIQAHGGGIIKLADTYYWFGEDRGRDNERGRRYVACYSSKDLAHWTFRNQVLKLADPENFGRGWV